MPMNENFFGDPHERTSRQGAPQMEDANRRRLQGLLTQTRNEARQARTNGNLRSEADAAERMAGLFRALGNEQRAEEMDSHADRLFRRLG